MLEFEFPFFTPINIFKKKSEHKQAEEQKEAVSHLKNAVASPLSAEKEKNTAPLKDNEESYRFLLNPYLTEKTTALSALNQYAFRVAPGANKVQIKQAVEKLYGVKVRAVKVLRMPSKKRQLGRFKGEKTGFKKALVRLKEGDKIDLAV